MNPNVDLSKLALRREAPSAPKRRSLHFGTRYVLPAAVLLGFASLFTWAMRDQFVSVRAVTVVPVLTSKGEVQAAGVRLFEAPGWIEPRPTPSVVTALAEGVVNKLLVVEGQDVEANQPIAEMIRRDAELAVLSAEAELNGRKAELAGSSAALAAAKLLFEQPTHLQAALRDAEGMLQQKNTELAALPFQLQSAQSRLELARKTQEVTVKSFDTVPVLKLNQAQSDVEQAKAQVSELQARGEALKREVQTHTARVEALHKRLELRTDEERAFKEAQAKLQGDQARVQHAQVAFDSSKLRLERMTVRAPTAGRILSVVARPGLRMVGMAAASAHDASTVATMYHPDSLQVRADVRLEDVPKVQVGQEVALETQASRGPLVGRVLKLTSQADIQKNTLQVKVAIESPTPTLRPDMLVRVMFMSMADERNTPATPTTRLFVPRNVIETGDGGAHVWLVDTTAKHARRQKVQLGQAVGDLVEVTSGLNPADRLIAGGRDGLREGERIRVTGEDTQGIVDTPKAK